MFSKNNCFTFLNGQKLPATQSLKVSCISNKRETRTFFLIICVYAVKGMVEFLEPLIKCDSVFTKLFQDVSFKSSSCSS